MDTNLEEWYDQNLNIPDMNEFCKNVKNKLMISAESRYAVIVFDIDNFKVINELYGIKEGNLVLERISNIIQKCISKNGIYARMHSDIFCIFIDYKLEEDIILLVSRITGLLYTKYFGYELKPSFGIYKVMDKDIPIRTMCDRANMAKKTIKGNLLQFFAFYEDYMMLHMLKEKAIEDDIGKALAENQFVMYLQPKYDIASSKPIGSEALVRWIHPKKGIISPVDFVPLFEKNGFIVVLDEYIWEEAMKALRDWLNDGIEPIPISINISRLHISDSSFVETLVGLMNTYKIPRHLIELELTESAFLSDTGSLLTVMKRLHKAGFTLSMDDFGAGYSSLNLLKDVPIDIIKLDQVFLNEKVTTPKGKTVIRSMITLAKELGIQVIAEGVETKEQAEFLLESGCNLAQGYYYSKPISRKEFEKQIYHIVK